MLQRRAGRLAALIAVLVGSVGFAVGCPAPCVTDSECGDDQFCGVEEFCTRECDIDTDCDSNSQRCSNRGKCEQSLIPTIRWISPAEGADVGEVFDAELEVSFRANLVELTLARDASAPGDPCAPLPPPVVLLAGDVNQDIVQRVVLPNISALGRSFSLRAAAAANGLQSSSARAFVGTPPAGLGGAQIVTPRESVLNTNTLTTEFIATFEPAAGLASVWVEPLRGDPSPRATLGQNTTTLPDDTLVPLARGRQTIWVETERQGVVTRCGTGINVVPEVPTRGLEIGLFFQSESDAELDLWIFSERDGVGEDVCTVDAPRDMCRDASQSVPFRKEGQETLNIALEEGVYGIAVAPAIVSEPVSARIRLSTEGIHLGWLGPRSVFAQEGQVWLAGRIYVLNGNVTIEPLEDMVDGLPAIPVSSW